MKQQTEKREIPPVPGLCTSADCLPTPSRKVALVLVEIEDENYQRAIGPASMFKINNQWKYGVDVKSWHARCTNCLYSDPVKTINTWTGG